jgi:CheY-like chemotaxis protein
MKSRYGRDVPIPFSGRGFSRPCFRVMGLKVADRMASDNPSTQQRDDHQPVDLPVTGSRGPHQFVILVAEDAALIRNLVTLLMQREGHFVLSAADGQEGLELSRQYPGTIDLLITDITMPRLNGTDLCAHLMEERPGIRVLVMSGADVRTIVRQNVNMLFLPKPFDGETLKARVRAILAVPGQPSIDLNVSKQSGA